MKKTRGFTLIELMIVVAIIGILAAIAIPNFIRFQARARQAEPHANLKSLFTAVKSQQQRPASNAIKAVGFAVERGNRYQYRMDPACTGGTELRTTLDVVGGNADSCIGVDTARFPAILDTDAEARLIRLATPTWNTHGTASGLGSAEGVHGLPGNWDFLAYASGDVDNDVTTADSMFDSWSISSADATASATCPASPAPVNVAAGEPFNTANDVNCQ